MSENNSSKDKSMLAIPGGLLLGVGAGFFFFPVSVFGFTSVFAFCGCIVGGLGVGLFAAAILPSNPKKD
jgi:uncharacterized membrane protein